MKELFDKIAFKKGVFMAAPVVRDSESAGLIPSSPPARVHHRGRDFEHLAAENRMLWRFTLISVSTSGMAALGAATGVLPAGACIGLLIVSLTAGGAALCYPL